eukprot:Sspe_Gene.12719::Locus_4342_Transcript_1_1_Confidence_1.000_Length_866::g.12719::m.12719
MSHEYPLCLYTGAGAELCVGYPGVLYHDSPPPAYPACCYARDESVERLPILCVTPLSSDETRPPPCPPPREGYREGKWVSCHAPQLVHRGPITLHNHGLLHRAVKRYAVLRTRWLELYPFQRSLESEQEPSECIDVANTTIASLATPYQIQIAGSHLNKGSLLFSVASKEERKEWMEALEE